MNIKVKTNVNKIKLPNYCKKKIYIYFTFSNCLILYRVEVDL